MDPVAPVAPTMTCSVSRTEAQMTTLVVLPIDAEVCPMFCRHRTCGALICSMTQQCHNRACFVLLFPALRQSLHLHQCQNTA